MAYDLFTGSSDDEQAKIAYLMQLFQHARQQRLNFEVSWEESAALCWPEYRNSFSFGHVRAPGVKYTQYQVDSSAAIKAWRFMCIADAMLTPHNMMWSKYQIMPTDGDTAYLMKDHAVRLHADTVTRIIWNERYRPEANFKAQMQTNWGALGVFGNIAQFCEGYDARPLTGSGLRYMAEGPGQVYVLQNHQGRVNGAIVHLRWNAEQAHQRWGDKIPPAFKAARDKADVYTLFDILHFIIPRNDYDPHRLFAPQGKPWASIYVSQIGYSILEEGGFYSFPLPHGRYMQAPDEWYGRGPAQQVLPELKTKNSEKEAFLKQGALAGDPAYLLPGDDLFDFKAQSGAYNYGGMSSDGKPLVGVLPTGNVQITKELMDDSDRNIDAAFLVDLFPLLFDTKNGNIQRSAREVLELANQMAIFLAPTLGRQYSEFLGTQAERELDLVRRQGKLPKMPPAMVEAGGRYQVWFTGPLARALNSQGIAGYMRTVELATQVAQATGDKSVFNVFAHKRAFPEIAEMQYAPTRWMSTPEEIAALEKAQQQEAERDHQVQELPGKAAIMKAEAITAKARTGGNIGGTLSGTPQGGMPQVPGNPPGQPGQPGIGGQPGLPGQPAP